MWQWCLRISGLTGFRHAPMFALPRDISGMSPRLCAGMGGAWCEYVAAVCPLAPAMPLCPSLAPCIEGWCGNGLA